MLELFALVFAFAVLVKIVLYYFRPKTLLDSASFFAKSKTALMFLFVLLSLASGYFVLTQVSAVQVGAVMFFYTSLIGLSFVQFADEFLAIRKKFLANKGKFWILTVVWLVFSLWLLYAVLIGT